MPFSFLKSSKEDGPRAASRNDTGVKLDSDSSEKVQRRKSKRDYFRNLLKLSSISSDSKVNRRKSGQAVTSQAQPSPKSPSPPMSPMDKPLPPPPPGPDAEPEPARKAPVKLERIISPLALSDLHQIFSGAPQFFARSEGHSTGAPHPSVCFPWDEEVHIRDLTDHWKIHDEAWGGVTAWPHITIQATRNPDATKKHHEKQRAHFLPRCRERPNMLSMQGLERGTIGYQAALETAVADALEIENEHTDASPEVIEEHRRKFLNGKDGLRPITDTALIDRLLDVSEVYHEDPLKHQRPSVQLYSELFTQILFPPTRVTEHDDPYSLQVQIESIIRVLSAPLVWIDFSLVEWRIRLGSILWGASSDSDSEDGVSVNNEIGRDPGSQRYWLLVQVLLSCELLIRLDAISMIINHGLNLPKPAEIENFEQSATSSVKWSLILARAWLDNIRIEKPETETLGGKKSAGWYATLTGTTNMEAAAADGRQGLRFYGRHQTRQLSGLLHFARNIHWPEMESLAAKAASNGITISDSVQSTPAATPMTMGSQRSSSYFSHRRPVVKRGLSLHQHVSSIIHPAGWLSNSYLSGLILPGEGLGHFLISTLLENDSEAISRLGEQACLYGGFLYCEKSFWSTACVVGRVLAAGKGASECMGWISSGIVPKGVKEGWVDIDVETGEPIDDAQKRSSKPRLWRKQTIEHDSHVIGGADTSTVLPGDFIMPSDESTQEALSVTLESLDLFAAEDSVPGTPVESQPTPLSEVSFTPMIQNYSAMMRFTVEAADEGKREINIALNHDVQFVTAHPCISTPHIDILKSATGTSISSPNSRSQSPTTGAFTSSSGHPLHKGFTYTKIPISKVLSTPLSIAFGTLLSLADADSTQSSTHTTTSRIPKVIIIDCTDASMVMFPPRPSISPHASTTGAYGSVRASKKHEYGSDLEMIARALCAERGWNALISRRGRGCLACAIREAGALDWRVIIRVA